MPMVLRIRARTFEGVRSIQISGAAACVFATACTSVERVEVHDVTQAMQLSEEANVVQVNGVEQRGYVSLSRNGPTLVTAHEKKIQLRPSDKLTMKVRYRPSDVVTPEIAFALRERSVELM